MDKRYRRARTVGLWGGIKNALLAGFKIIFGLSGHSHALLADGLHSLSDLLVDGVVIVASKFGSKAADDDHPYGHGRIETAATVMLAFVLVAAALAIFIDAGKTLFAKEIVAVPAHYVLIVALLSILCNEILYFWTKHVAQQIHSKLLLSNAWHHRSDSAASFAVAIGVIGAWVGFPKLDALAALFVALLILKVAWQFGWQSMQELVDTALTAEESERLQQFILSLPGVQALHQFRTRSVAGNIFCDVHVLVDPTLSVSEGHHISQSVEAQLMTHFPQVHDVTVHIDTEDDQVSHLSQNLPSRATLQPLLEQTWQGLIPQTAIQQALIHYREGHILIELRLPLHFCIQTDLQTKLDHIKERCPFIQTIQLFYYTPHE